MMKRLSLLLVVMLMLGMTVTSLFAETVTIGTGDQTARVPMDFFWKSSLFQTLYYPDELGFTSGTITALEFYNSFPADLSLNGKATKIWLGTTNLPDLGGGYIPATQLTLVFDGTVDYPAGENTISITLQTPYTHTPGNLVMLVERPMDTEYFSSSSYFKCQTIGTNRARVYRSDSTAADPNSPPAGTASGQFPMTKITYTPVTIVNDLGAMTISGNTTPTAGTSYNYTVSVKNNGTATQSTYQVKLMSGTNELASVAGPTVTSLETVQVIIPWTPTTAGTMSIFGKVVLAGDEIAANNETSLLELNVQPTGISAVTIGDGSQEARMPMDFYYKSSLFQCLYYPDELGFLNGTISSVAFINNFTSNNPTGATKIWMGNTNLLDLSAGWIPSTQMTLVFDGNVQYPAGQNTVVIPLQTPFNYTPGNLVMMVQRPMDTQYWSSNDKFKCQTVGMTRARNYYNDSTELDPTNPTGGTLTGQFPQTIFFYTGQAIEHDLGALSLTGNTTPSVGAAENYIVTVKNNGASTENTYQVKLMSGTTELASVAGPAIQSQQVLEISLPWTPAATGTMEIYGKVIMTGDQIATNDQTLPLSVSVQAAGVVTVTVGDGSSTDRYPFDFYWKNSLFETVFQASEMNIGGVISGIQFYNQFTQDVGSKPVKVWLLETTQTDLAGGWIPANQMTLVYDGNIVFPNGSNDIFIPVDPPFPYGGGNLVMMTNRCMDTQYYNSTNYFKVQPGGITGRSRWLRADSTEFDPNNPEAGTATDLFPQTTFFLVTEGMGSLSGTVYGPGNTPMSGVTVAVANTSLVYTTGDDGTYSFPYIYEGSQTVSATKHGYTTDTHTVTIVEDQTTTQNFNIALLPQVTVTGRIVGSDQPTVGLADATITLSGYEPYTATTNAQGQFTIPNVFASQTYQYVAAATGYQVATGQAVVGTTNLNMGDIIVNEMAFPPFAVQANENDAFTQVAVTWEAPDPNAVEITEGFEDATFPPTDWTQVITNTTDTGALGVLPTWSRFGTVALTPAVPPSEGEWQTGLWWGYDPQDEWLITPQFVCPPNGAVTFDSYVYYGSTNSDHYYIKISTDNGATWNVLWDASTLTGGWNHYDAPISIPLTDYAGQQIKLAWNAQSAPNDGLWYVWFVDNIHIGNPDRTIRFNHNEFTTKSASEHINRTLVMNTGINLPTSRAKMENPDLVEARLNVPETNKERVMMGYKVWRLLHGQETNETAWTSLTPTNITATNYTDTAWQPLPSGVYKYAVKAAYTNNVYSNPAFSNEIHKGMMGVLTGTVTEFGTNLPIEGATITAGEYSGTSNAQGVYSFSVYAGTYEVTCAKVGYQTATQAGVVMVGLQTTTQNFVLTEITLPPGAVVAEEVGANVNVTWGEPGTSGGEWLSYCGEKDDSIGTGGTVEFDVAVRYPGADLTDYIGMSLQAVKVWPAQAGNFAVRVWTGGSPTAPGPQVVHQPFTADLDVYNTVILTDPVAITGNEEVWFGYNCNVTGGYPAGCDAGPAVNGFGNMMYFNGVWDTLLGIAPSLNYNWCIEGYVGYSAPTDAPRITFPGSEKSFGGLVAGEEGDMTRALQGYRVWRLMQGQETNESTWTSLTPNPISATGFQDTGWAQVADGTYKWAVKAIYTGGAASVAALSNPLPKITEIGTIVGIVRNQQQATIAGATITCAGYTATTNANGAYSMQVIAGTHSVTASHPDYASVTQENVTVVTGQTTTVNFVLPPSSILFEDGFETYPDFVIDFAPWTVIDVDQSATYRIGGYDWPNAEAPQAFIIFNPSATVPVLDFAAHGGSKFAASFAAVNAPNNDWMITPQLNGVTELKFWARSYNTSYGLEKFKVGVSTTGTAPADFTIISGTTPVAAPAEWTEYTYPLAQYSGSPAYIGINCVSPDVFIFLVDDVVVNGSVSADDPTVPVLKTALNKNYPNPFNPETTISYSLSQGENVKIEIYNVKGQLVRTLVNEDKAAGDHSVVWTGVDNNNRPVSSGVYYYKMTAGKYSSSKKMILMK